MSMPKWEVPFYALGKVLLALPNALESIATDATQASNDFKMAAITVTKLLSEAKSAMNQDGLNIALDASVASDFLTALSTLTKMLGV